jgi:large subunit ribosomal protein L7/L12
MADLKKLAEEIVNLTLLQAQELKQILKDEYGIEPAAGGAVMMAAGPPRLPPRPRRRRPNSTSS